MSRHREIIDRRLRAHYRAYWQQTPEDWEELLNVWEDTLSGLSEQAIREAFAKAARRCTKPEDLDPAKVAAVATKIPASVLQIIEAVADETCVTVSEIMGNRRTNVVVRPRQVAMYLARTATDKSWEQIGLAFGGKDHTTVIHAYRKIGGLLRRDADVARTVSNCKARLGVTL